MADRIVVMNAGRIEQIGTPQDVYDRPNSRFVARFIGGSNVIEARHEEGNRVRVDGHTLEVGGGDFPGAGRDMAICVKMHDVELLPNGEAAGSNVLSGVVRSHAYLGSHRDYVIGIAESAPQGAPGQDLLVTAPAGLVLEPGANVGLRVRPDKCRGLAK